MSKYNRIFKLTEAQLLEYDETSSNLFTNDSETPQYNGFSQITPNGKVEPDDFAEPKTTDDFAQKLNTQRIYRCGGAWSQPSASKLSLDVDLDDKNIKESKELDNDKDDDGVDDFYNHEELDTLSNGDSKDNLTRIPESVQMRCNALLQEMSKNKLSPKQSAIILNRLIEAIDLRGIPYAWLKELKLKIK